MSLNERETEGESEKETDKHAHNLLFDIALYFLFALPLPQTHYIESLRQRVRERESARERKRKKERKKERRRPGTGNAQDRVGIQVRNDESHSLDTT